MNQGLPVRPLLGVDSSIVEFHASSASWTTLDNTWMHSFQGSWVARLGSSVWEAASPLWVPRVLRLANDTMQVASIQGESKYQQGCARKCIFVGLWHFPYIEIIDNPTFQVNRAILVIGVSDQTRNKTANWIFILFLRIRLLIFKRET